MVKNKNNKDIDHLEFSQPPFLSGLMNWRSWCWNLGPYRWGSGAVPLNYTSLPAQFFFLLPYINCILLLPLLFKPELRMSAFFPGAWPDTQVNLMYSENINPSLKYIFHRNMKWPTVARSPYRNLSSRISDKYSICLYHCSFLKKRNVRTAENSLVWYCGMHVLLFKVRQALMH